MTVYHDNMKFIIAYSGLKQKAIAKELQMDVATINRLIKRPPKKGNSLQRVLKYISNLKNIPYDLFEDSQALQTKDISKILPNWEQSLLSFNNNAVSIVESHDKKNDIQPSGKELTNHEIDLIYFFRQLKHGSKYLPLSETTIKRIQETIDIIGIDDEVQLSFLKFVSSTRRRYGTEITKEEKGKKGDD